VRWLSVPGSAALALVRAGIDVQVYEQAQQLAEVGAGVALAPNGLRMLDRLGVGDGVMRLGARHVSTELLLSDGRPARHEPDQFARPGRNMRMHRAGRARVLGGGGLPWPGAAPGRLLGASQDPAHGPHALATYERLRRDRTARVQLGSRRNGAGYDSSASQLTDRRWIYEHDAWAEAVHVPEQVGEMSGVDGGPLLPGCGAGRLGVLEPRRGRRCSRFRSR
jgi:2-polyprenyl-6-methoxyphenol hydroxylase-like FAD-dependent oxidoreductase